MVNSEKLTIREVKWMSSHLRPAPMPSVECPRVRIYGADKCTTESMGINHCLACACACEIHLDMKKETGEVYCAG
jgi:hypothetical protein